MLLLLHLSSQSFFFHFFIILFNYLQQDCNETSSIGDDKTQKKDCLLHVDVQQFHSIDDLVCGCCGPRVNIRLRCAASFMPHFMSIGRLPPIVI